MLDPGIRSSLREGEGTEAKGVCAKHRQGGIWGGGGKDQSGFWQRGVLRLGM